MADKKPVGTIGTASQNITTNIYGVSVPADLQVYRYHVTIQAVKTVNGHDRVIDLTKKARSDAIVTNRKDLCRSIFLSAVEQHPTIFGDLNEMCYDLQSTLFARKLISTEIDGITITITNPNIQTQLPGATAQIKVKPVKDTRVLDPSEMTNITTRLDDVDHSLQQYLELETSQAALMDPAEHITYPGGKSFLMQPGAHGFSARDVPSLGHSKFLGIGCQKSIRYIEGRTKKTPFHQCQPMVQAAGHVTIQLMLNSI